ncbi:hypothetical protein VKT23_013959 [Stygiomarasmius scandens]|uniref:Mid2 domain-containing protein n=1 Tax=Marasmiellus scandens TaxID=2682957 RepID=A0ABR1J1Y8_9AGAR
MPERTTTLFLFGDDFLDATDELTMTPVGTADDGSETTLEYALPETTTKRNGPTMTWTNTAIVVVSSGGFKEVQSFVPTVTDADTPGLTGFIDCTSDKSSNQGQCSISFDDITLQETGTRIPWVVLVAEPDNTTSSSQSASVQSISPSDATSNTKGFFQNKAAVIATFTVAGIVLLVIVMFLITRRSRQRRRSMTHDMGIQPRIRTVPGWTPLEPDAEAQPRMNLNLPKVPERVPDMYTNEKKNPIILSAESSTQPTSTSQQTQSQGEVNALRTQMQELQRAVNTSNQDMQSAMARMVSHMQVQSNSDEAKHSGDELPPRYEAD